MNEPLKELKIFRSGTTSPEPDIYTEVVHPAQLYCPEFEATLILSIAAQAGIRTYVQTVIGGILVDAFVAHERLVLDCPPYWVIGEDKLQRELTYLDLSRIAIKNGNICIANVRFPLDDPTFNLSEKIKKLTREDVNKACDENYNRMIERHPHLEKILGKRSK